ncbi:hypothetical protein AWN76_011000 [Rhodothermaceae bacterium RA]|nr:hypothetical protein AWN76_011000 [Rhodothermaceae bacterium RA]
MRSRRVLMSLAVLLATLCPRAANAQTPDAAQQAADALRTGRYAEAQTAYRTLVNAAVGTPEGAAHALPYAATFLAVGAYTDGLAAIEAYLRRAPEDPYLHHARGRLLAALGRYEEAEAAYDRAGRLPDFWRNDLERGLLRLDRGDRRAAFAHLAGIYRAYREGRIRTADALAVAARAAAALEEYRNANEAFRTAHRMDATQPLTLYWWAELFREKFNEADAERSYRDALALNPAYADAYVGLARTSRRFEAQEDLAQQALRHNPHHVGALSLLAELRILDGLYDEAEAVVARALAVNPNSVDALAQLASIHYLRGDSAAFRAVEQRVLAQGRRESAFYLTLATNAERRFRYPDALAFSRQATLVDRSSARAHTQLGTALLRLGHLDEARRHLEIAYERDPFNLFAANSLTLLDERAAFATLTGEHVTLYLPADERDVLGPLMLEVAEAAYDSLVARYPYRPPAASSSKPTTIRATSGCALPGCRTWGCWASASGTSWRSTRPPPRVARAPTTGPARSGTNWRTPWPSAPPPSTCPAGSPRGWPSTRSAAPTRPGTATSTCGSCRPSSRIACCRWPRSTAGSPARPSPGRCCSAITTPRA